MKWVDGECRLSDDMRAAVYDVRGNWFAEIYAGDYYMYLSKHKTETAAKSAVAAWIGKTMAQLSNALARGEPRTFDDDGA